MIALTNPEYWGSAPIRGKPPIGGRKEEGYFMYNNLFFGVLKNQSFFNLFFSLINYLSNE